MRSMMTIDSAAIRLTDTILGHDELARIMRGRLANVA